MLSGIMLIYVALKIRKITYIRLTRRCQETGFFMKIRVLTPDSVKNPASSVGVRPGLLYSASKSLDWLKSKL